jgi:hypothetical protein
VIRNGYLAVWGGAEYDASPAADGTVRLYRATPADGFDQLAPGRYRRVVRADEVAMLRYVRTVCVWRDARFVVIGGHGEWLRLECLDPDESLRDGLGLERFDEGVHQGWAPRAEVTDLVEEYVGG